MAQRTRGGRVALERRRAVALDGLKRHVYADSKAARRDGDPHEWDARRKRDIERLTISVV